MSKKKYFGTDGIRGLVGAGPITPDFFQRLGYVAGKILHDRVARLGSTIPKVIIGKDTRISGYIFESALQTGFLASGVDVFLTGPMPTPAIAFLTRKLEMQGGVVISASHNSYEYNGVKFFNHNGSKLPDELETKIESGIDRTRVLDLSTSPRLGKSFRANNGFCSYVEFCINSFPNDLSLKGKRLVIDCANGATYRVAETIFKKLGAEIVMIGSQPDGFNINHECGSLHVEKLSRRVVHEKAELGLAFDGDGDRIIIVDSRGRVFDGDSLLYLIAMDRGRQEKLGGGVVGTLMTNFGLERAFKEGGINFVRTSVGDRYVLEELNRLGWLVGGENSGHIVCLDKQSTGDAIICALEILEVLLRTGVTLSELCKDLSLVPQVLINVPIKSHYDFKLDRQVQDMASEMRERLSGAGRILLRASGTEDVIRIMVESADQTLARSMAEALASRVKESAEKV